MEPHDMKTDDIVNDEWKLYSFDYCEWRDFGKACRAEIRRRFAAETDPTKDGNKEKLIDRKRATLVLAYLAKKYGDLDSIMMNKNVGVIEVNLTTMDHGEAYSLDLGDLDISSIRREDVESFLHFSLEEIVDRYAATYRRHTPITPGNYPELWKDVNVKDVRKFKKNVFLEVCGGTEILDGGEPLYLYGQLDRIVDKLSDLDKFEKAYRYYEWELYADFLAQLLQYCYDLEVHDGKLKFTPRVLFGVAKHDNDKFCEHVSNIIGAFEEVIGESRCLTLWNNNTENPYALIYASVFDSGLLFNSKFMREVRIIQGHIRGPVSVYYGLTKVKVNGITRKNYSIDRLSAIFKEMKLVWQNVTSYSSFIVRDPISNMQCYQHEDQIAMLGKSIEDLGMAEVGEILIYGKRPGRFSREIDNYVEQKQSFRWDDWENTVIKRVYSVKRPPDLNGNWRYCDLQHGISYLDLEDKWMIMIGTDDQLISEICNLISSLGANGYGWKRKHVCVFLKVSIVELRELVTLQTLCNTLGFGIRVGESTQVDTVVMYLEIGTHIHETVRLLEDWLLCYGKSVDACYQDVVGRMFDLKIANKRETNVRNNLSLVKLVKRRREIILESVEFESVLKSHLGSNQRKGKADLNREGVGRRYVSAKNFVVHKIN